MRKLNLAGFVLGALAVLTGLALLAWIGGELHYRNCLANVELRYPVAYWNAPNAKQAEINLGLVPPPHFVFHNRANRSEAIASCSRLP